MAETFVDYIMFWHGIDPSFGTQAKPPGGRIVPNRGCFSVPSSTGRTPNKGKLCIQLDNNVDKTFCHFADAA